jgi:hypothetical protein
MGFSVVEATNARCMRRNRAELRWLVRTDLFFVVAADFLWERAGFDCAWVGELVLSVACADSGADDDTSALKHSAKRKDLENPTTFL